VQKSLLMLVLLFGLIPAMHAQGSAATAPAQPIPFDHKLHMQDAKTTCNDCHEPRGEGSTLALPQPPRCMKCHTSIAADKPDIKRIAEAAKNEDPIQWVRVYRVPSFVTFSHKTHAGNTCEECHGPVAERTAIFQEKDTNMGSCIACHQAKKAPTTCDTCHAIMSTQNGHSPFEAAPTVLGRLRIQPVRRPAAVMPVEANNTRGTLPTTLARFLSVPAL
jgi:hypothetical protein